MNLRSRLDCLRFERLYIFLSELKTEKPQLPFLPESSRANILLRESLFHLFLLYLLLHGTKRMYRMKRLCLQGVEEDCLKTVSEAAKKHGNRDYKKGNKMR